MAGIFRVLFFELNSPKHEGKKFSDDGPKCTMSSYFPFHSHKGFTQVLCKPSWKKNLTLGILLAEFLRDFCVFFCVIQDPQSPVMQQVKRLIVSALFELKQSKSWACKNISLLIL